MYSLFTSKELVLKYPKIYGIATSLRVLRMGFVLSCHPDLDVYAVEDVPTYDAESVHGAFHVTFLDDHSKVLCIKNKGTNGYFYPKYKRIDYLICSLEEEEINQELIKILAKLKGISLCFALDNPNKKEIVNFSQLQ